MKTARTGALSGCAIWLLVFSLFSLCLIPTAMLGGSLSTAFQSEAIIELLAPTLCPPETTGRLHTYATTTRDSNGFETPSTGYALHCVDASGNLIEDTGGLYGLLWVGIWGLAALLLAAGLAVLLAAPAGAFIARRLKHRAPATPPPSDSPTG